MRVAVPGYAPGKGFKRFDVSAPFYWVVTIDGRRVERVVAFDSAAGVVWRHQLDTNGCYVVDLQKDEIKVERLYGPVRAELMERSV